jgi:hypothetical protein
MGEGRGAYRVLVGKPEGKRPIGIHPDVDGRIILRWNFRKWDVRVLDWTVLAKDWDRDTFNIKIAIKQLKISGL